MLNKGPVHQPDKSKVPAMKSRTLMIWAIIMLCMRIFNNIKGFSACTWHSLYTYHFHSVLKKRRWLTSFRATIN